MNYYGSKCKYESITCMERSGCNACEIELQHTVSCDECIEKLRGH